MNNTGLLLGYGNGTFQDERIIATESSSSIPFALCDYNKDNQLDAIIVNNDTGSIGFLTGYFKGFQSPQSVDVQAFINVYNSQWFKQRWNLRYDTY